MTPRLQKSVEEMATFCRDLLYTSVPIGGGVWNGPLQPLDSNEYRFELLDDIHHNRAVHVAAGGILRHLDTCGHNHCRHEWMDRIAADNLLRSFSIRIYYTGDREDPRCWVEGVNQTNARHIWGNDGSICPFLSSKNTWDWSRDTVADFVGHASVWLVSWMVFQQTGVWIVGEHDGTPAYHLAHVKRSALCWCRSGRKYRKCHMKTDQQLMLRSH